MNRAAALAKFLRLGALLGLLLADVALGEFNKADVDFLQRFTLAALGSPPAAPDNLYADSADAAKLGQRIFFDPGFSDNGAVSCASCHQPSRYFTDGRSRSLGHAETRRNAPSLLTSAHGPWLYWDGRKDSQWSQALEPFEQVNEHRFDRGRLVNRIQSHYAQDYRQVFGAIESESRDAQTRVFVNIGKALMAYQRRLTLQPSRFDRFVEQLQENDGAVSGDVFSADEVSGLRLFMGKAACVSCHNGPLFSNFEFHNIGVPEANSESVDLGRFEGIESLRNGEFNCLSKWSDADPDQCAELTFLKRNGPELVGAFKTPSLRNVAETEPYMHSGQFADLKEVLQHYNNPPPPFYDSAQHPNRPHFDLLPLGLTERELEQLRLFLVTLTSPLPSEDPWWTSGTAE